MSSADGSHAEQVLNNLGAYLAAVGLTDWDGGSLGYGPDYSTDTEWPVTLGPDMPIGLPRVLVLTALTATSQRGNVTQGVQVRGRDAADETPWRLLTKLQQIRDHFHPGGFARSSFVMGALPVSRVDIVSEPQPLSRDGERRPAATLNLRIHSRRVVRS